MKKYFIAASMALMVASCGTPEEEKSDSIATYETAVGCASASQIVANIPVQKPEQTVFNELAREIFVNARAYAMAQRINKSTSEVAQEIYFQSVGMDMNRTAESFENIWNLTTGSCRQLFASKEKSAQYDELQIR